MTLMPIVAGLLALATLVAMTRLILWQRAAEPGLRASRARLIALVILQPLCALLLFFGLFPPNMAVKGGSLRIATHGAPSPGAPADGPLITLPEATARPDAEGVPDLATALRRHPDTQRIIVLGDGLTPRDIDGARGLAVRFVPAPPRPGIIALTAAVRTAPGAPFVVGGQVAGFPRGTVELIDPAGQVTDSQPVDSEGRFLLTGSARAAGQAEFSVRVRDGRGRQADRADVPVLIADAPAPRLLILAAAPGPEVKYLRRWAIDAGFDVVTQMSAGGGIALGDAPVAIDGASLRRFDAAIIDDRSWNALGERRGVVLGAVRDGLGLILRPSGPLDPAARSQWQATGFALSGPGGIAPLALPKAQPPALARTRRGIGTDDVPLDMALPDDILPELSRLAQVPGGVDTVPLIRDATGVSLAAWRATGKGRLALFSPIDSYALVLTGRRDLYGDWWSDLLGTVARPASASSSMMAAEVAWVGERMRLCGIAGTTRVRPPGQPPVLLRTMGDCAAYWPDAPGWHLVETDGAKPGREPRFLFVQPADALPAVKANRDRQATLALRNDQSIPMKPAGTKTQPGSPWPWLLAWLTVCGMLWWLERSRIGRKGGPQTY